MSQLSNNLLCSAEGEDALSSMEKIEAKVKEYCRDSEEVHNKNVMIRRHERMQEFLKTMLVSLCRCVILT